MAKILGGTVTYGRTINLGDYNSKKAEATIGFSVEDGGSIDEASAVAVAKVNELLNITPAKAVTVLAAPLERFTTTALAPKETHDAAGIKEANAGKLEAEKRKPGRPPKVTPAAEAPKPVDDEFPETDKPQISTGEERKGPEDTAGDEWGAEAPAVTDLDLTSKINHKNGELRKVHGDAAAPKIRQLIGKYVTPPKQARDIPGEARAKFLEDLAALA